MSDWRPIATAPKDGTRILGWIANSLEPYASVVWFWGIYGSHDPGIGRWQDEHGGEFGELDVPPTHWMPLPEPPHD